MNNGEFLTFVEELRDLLNGIVDNFHFWDMVMYIDISIKKATKENLYKMDYFKQFATVLDKAIFLTEVLLDWGNMTQWLDELDRYLTVSHYDVSRAANKYLNEEKVFIKIETK